MKPDFCQLALSSCPSLSAITCRERLETLNNALRFLWGAIHLMKGKPGSFLRNLFPLNSHTSPTVIKDECLKIFPVIGHNATPTFLMLPMWKGKHFRTGIYLRDLWLQHLDRRGCGIRHVSQFSLTLKEVNTTVLHYKNWIQKQTYAGSNDFFLLLSWWYPTTQILL